MFTEALLLIVTGLSAQPEPERSVTLAFGGDVMLGRLVNATIREQGADVVVFSIHWGPNMRQAPTWESVEFAGFRGP